MIQKIKRSSLTGFLRYWGILCFCVGGTLQGQNIVSPISFVPDNSVQVHNLALNRAAYHSSCSNFDYTAHLITDGNTDVQGDSKITVQYSDFPSGESPENLFDGSPNSKYLTFHSEGWIQYEFANGASYIIDRYVLTSANDDEKRDPKNWTFSGSNDGKNWTLLDTRSDIRFNKRKESFSFTAKNTNAYRMYRLDITDNRGDNRTQLSEIDLFEKNVSRIDRSVFSSKWESAGKEDQWVYVDLGTICRINKVKLFWGEEFARSYQIQFSTDKRNWRSLYSTNEGKGGIEEIKLTTATAKYVRLYMTDGISEYYSLAEMEVYGTGGVIPEQMAVPYMGKEGAYYLTGGNWKVQRASLVKLDGLEVSDPVFDDRDWIIATVPGTVLTSYLNIGAIPDPNFGDQQLQISDAFFTADFWYRTTFIVPNKYKEKRIWLNLNGINWKADVFVNGHRVGDIKGAFIRGKFDITPYVVSGEKACIAVYIYKNDTPGQITVQSLNSAGKNGGVLGADNPTIHASVGWDWLPTMRGRNIGIQDDVFISATNDVSLIDPFIISDLPLPDLSSADLTLRVELQNHSDRACKGKLMGIINPGNIRFSRSVSLNAFEHRDLVLDKNTLPQLCIENPDLWWPNGYGEQNMYSLELSFVANGGVSDKKTIPFGIREMSYDESDGVLKTYVNGTRIFFRGGNWGLSESMLRLDKEGYDVRVRLHKEENFNMIRNWVGMTGDEDFYRACDKYGVMVWDDFWLANPGDGPNPNDEKMFMKNAVDKIKHFRNHPSIALYCGRNEGNPPETLNKALREQTSLLDGTRLYIPHSATGTVSGFGPYSVQNPRHYFKIRTHRKLHSEMGMPNIPSIESMKKMLPEDKYWPVNDVWGLHDFCIHSAQGASGFMNAVNRYGKASDLQDFCKKAQMVNMENHKAMFESFVGAQSNGMLMWMSQSAWPSTVWQTYDYYLDQTAGYYGCKKALEPLHILWDSQLDKVKVANNTRQGYKNLIAEELIYNMDGTLMLRDSVRLDSGSDTVTDCMSIVYPKKLSPVHFIKLELKDGNKIIADNFYWRGNKYQEYSDLSNMLPADLQYSLYREKSGGKVFLTVDIKNAGKNIALMTRLKVLRDRSKERVLPVYYSDNYFSLLPGETKQVILEFNAKDLQGENPVLGIEGWNIDYMEIVEF